MLTTVEILDRLKSKLGSDYRTAKELGIPQQRITKMRNSGGVFTDEQGLKAAQILGLKEEFVLLSLIAERSEKSPSYSILKRIADRFEPKSAAAGILFGCIFTLAATTPIPGISA
jgi:hypothetical protein